ncbi:MAG: hypothetical protein FJZ58_02095 [Chlamydiae bacterium]|nr:hypothetical protein [Chlamydiota bacterium]
MISIGGSVSPQRPPKVLSSGEKKQLIADVSTFLQEIGRFIQEGLEYKTSYDTLCNCSVRDSVTLTSWHPQLKCEQRAQQLLEKKTRLLDKCRQWKDLMDTRSLSRTIRIASQKAGGVLEAFQEQEELSPTSVSLIESFAMDSPYAQQEFSKSTIAKTCEVALQSGLLFAEYDHIMTSTKSYSTTEIKAHSSALLMLQEEAQQLSSQCAHRHSSLQILLESLAEKGLRSSIDLLLIAYPPGES